MPRESCHPRTHKAEASVDSLRLLYDLELNFIPFVLYQKGEFV